MATKHQFAPRSRRAMIKYLREHGLHLHRDVNPTKKKNGSDTTPRWRVTFEPHQGICRTDACLIIPAPESL